MRSEESFQRKLDDLLRFANDVRPALVLEEYVQCLESDLGASYVIGGEAHVSHIQAASVQ